MVPKLIQSPLSIFTRIFLVLITILAVVVAAFAAQPAVVRWFVSPGGGFVDGPGINIQASIGLPLAGVVDNEHTLCSGMICGEGVADTNQHFVYLPMLSRDVMTGINSSFEKESDYLHNGANGPPY